MTFGAEDDWAEVWAQFQALWEDMSSVERDAFWKNAAKYAYDMNHRSPQFRRLCRAVHDVESGRTVKRLTGLIPVKVRPRSADELQRAIVRHKAQLLLVESAQEFLVNSACNWIQFSFTAALNEMLDAVACERDDTGRRKGPIPYFAPEDAREKALNLASTHGTRRVTLVCAGLMLSDSGWNGLALARQSLQDGPQLEPAPSQPMTAPPRSQPEAIERGDSSEGAPLARATDSQADAPIVDSSSLDDLRAELAVLGGRLSAAASDATAGELPELSSIFEGWTQLRGRFIVAATHLNVESLHVADLADALATRNRDATFGRQLARCRAIKHVSEPNFDLIRSKCDELELDLAQGKHSATAELAVRSIHRLIEEGDHLDDNLVGDLQSEVEAVFGRATALAAVRGKLVTGSFEGDGVGSSGLAEPRIAETSSVESTELGTAPPPSQVAAEDDSLKQAGASSEAQLNLGLAAQQEDSSIGDTASDASATSAGLTQSGTAHAGDEAGNQESPPIQTVEQLPEPVAATAPELNSFDAFCYAHWVDASGQVASAPWSAPDFAGAVSRRALQAWHLGDAGLAYLFARAAQASGTSTLLDLDDLRFADELLSAPDSASAGRQPERIERLRHPAIDGEVKTLSAGLSVMLEALRPTLPCTLTSTEIDELIDRAAYHDSGIAEIARFLFVGWASQIDPLESLRRRLMDERPEPFEELERALRKAQEALRRDVTALWSAAGGKIQRTHCRAAWTRFVQEQVAPLRDELAPSGPKGLTAPKLAASSIASRVVGIGRAFVRIMDNAGVKHQDRSVSDAAAQQIVGAISGVADALSAVETRQKQDRTRSSYDGVPYDAGVRLLRGVSSNTTDRLCAALFASVVTRQPRSHALRLNPRHLLDHVDLIRFVDPGALTRLGLAKNGLSVYDVEEPRAASVLLWYGAASDRNVPENDEDFMAALRDAAAEGGRRDVLAALSQTDVLLDHQRTLLHQHVFDLAADTFQAARRLEALWSACDELMTPNEAKLKVIVDEAKGMTQPGQDSSVSVSKRLLRLNWLARCIDLAKSERDGVAERLLVQSRARSPATAERVQGYIQSEDYRAGFALLHGGTVSEGEPSRRGGRRTLWRDDAVARWPEPKTKLAQDLRGSAEEQQRLADIWASGAVESTQRDMLPKLLYTLISGESDRMRSERSPVRLGDLRDHQARRTVVDCEAIRSYFQKTGMNPTFLPQLASYGQIVITPIPLSSLRGGNISGDWAAAAMSDEATSVLYAYLAPGITLSRRDDLCADLRKRGITAAIIDDIDVCRLCAAFAGDHPQNFIPFLEVLLEQIDLARVSPFSSLDGQHIRLETYVGREQEARKIALGAEYTRLFSGRKLGKSALLKYVTDRFDLRKLDSENTLNVLFITIAGGDSESWVVDAILAAMTERFRLHERPSAHGLEAASRFMDYMNHFLVERPAHSVLLILDEADAFVEKQLLRNNLARDNSDREGSLSFRMMKQLPAQDAKGLPRIRTLFSGYRTTNTRGGVWANAGDVLLLPPLQEDEAVKFLQGMLARVGISLGSHAPFVAMRCGFQPAVLIRFGESLVKRLRRSTQSAHREKLVVTREEVSATLADQAVLDEIKTVVNNNFQGNRMGAVVFGATLLALKDLEPGFALTDGAVQVLNKLSKIDANLDWLERFDASPLAEIERNLQDFIERGLLTQKESKRRLGDREYRLRFPHFLTVLTRQSEVALEVRQQIQAIRAGGTQRGLAECVLSESSLNTVRYWYRELDTTNCRVVAVGGHWARALLDPKCGVPDRLGCDRHGVIDLGAAKPEISLTSDGPRVFCNASDSDWSELLATPATRPLVVIGGIDLQRGAMKHALEGGEIPVEVVTLGRLTQSTLSWWFEDARALHFSSGDAISRIALATDLVPYLVDALDLLLPQSPGTDVSTDELDASLRQLEALLPDLARELCEGHSSKRLLHREVQLMILAGRMADEVTEEFDLESDFQDCIEYLGAQADGVAPPLSEDGDWKAIKLLVESGLLPVRIEPNEDAGSRPLGRVRFDRTGPLFRVVKAMGSICAA